jgi:hypothetical protein
MKPGREQADSICTGKRGGLRGFWVAAGGGEIPGCRKERDVYPERP